MNERPILDRMGRPVNGREMDAISGVLYPCYFSIIPVLVQVAPDSDPHGIAEKAMEFALAACAKIGIVITDKSKENA
jgi:hypothetical protein